MNSEVVYLNTLALSFNISDESYIDFGNRKKLVLYIVLKGTIILEIKHRYYEN